MKKLKVIFIIIMILFLTGCGVNLETGQSFNTLLFKNGIIDNSYKQIEVVRSRSCPVGMCSSIYDYVYKNSDDVLVVRYEVKYKDPNRLIRKTDYYLATIYRNVTVNDVEICSPDDGNWVYSYEDNTTSKEPKYEFNYDDGEEYRIYERKRFILPNLYKVVKQ